MYRLSMKHSNNQVAGGYGQPGLLKQAANVACPRTYSRAKCDGVGQKFRIEARALKEKWVVFEDHRHLQKRPKRNGFPSRM